MVKPLEHFLVASPDVLSLRQDFCRSSFSGSQRILGYVRPQRIVALHPPIRGKRRSICGLHLEESLDWDRLHVALWRNWPSNAPLKDVDPELRHSMCLCAEVLRINLKILYWLLFKSLHSLALYISELLTPHSTPRPLRSENQTLLKLTPVPTPTEETEILLLLFLL